jgi:hypothetical protein
LEGRDSAGNLASGSPQVIQVNLVVQPACTLTSPSSQALSFSGEQGAPNPNFQNVLISGTGNCTWPLQISTTVSANATSWLKAGATSSPNIKGNGQSTSLTIGPNNGYPSLNTGTYTAQVTITATDSAGIVAQGSGQTITVSLTVLPPCSFAVPAPSSLSFTLTQGTAQGTAQNVALSALRGCAYYPLTYTVSTSAAWLTLTQPALDTGSGSMLGVNASATGLPLGTVQGQITVTALDTNGAPVLNPSTIPVTLKVVAPTISGTVYACTGVPPCVAGVPLPGATITVLDGSGATVTTVTADSSGNYVIPALPIGNYTVNVNGTLTLVQYTATGIALPVTGNATVNFDAYSG